MLSYVLAGLSLGAIYAIAAASLVVTYVSSGIFNFAFGAMAFAVARFYYWLNSQHGWSIWPAAAVSLLVFAPLLGAALYGLLFRHLRLRSPVVKIVATIGVSVALPELVKLILGDLADATAPGLAERPLRVFHPFNAAVNMDQVFTYVGLLVVLVVGVSVLRFTDVGLKVRALVDSEALTALSGTSPSRVSLGVWAASASLAGLAGILLAPTTGVSVEGMTLLMAAAFAAVVAARLRSLPLAVGVALLMGVVTTVIQKYLDPSDPLSGQIVPSIPFAFMLLFLLYYAVRGLAGDSAQGGALDRAIRPEGADTPVVVRSEQRRGWLSPSVVGPIITVVIAAILPLVFDEYWTGLAAGGICLGIALLSYTLVTGEGGMIWLCQITFAGFGAILAAELAGSHGWSPLVAIVVGAIFVVPIGVVLGLLTIRLGNLYVALVTLTFGLLASNLIFTRDPYYNFGQGTFMPRPDWAFDNQTLAYVALAAFVILALLIVNLRRSTAGLALNAVRWSETGSRTLGLSVVQMKVLVSGLATYVAAVGGGFLALNYQASLPDSFNPFIGLIWLAVLVSIGSRSVVAALVAGLVFALLPGVFAAYLPTDWSHLPTILFGLGAIMLARNPEGAIAQNARQLTDLAVRLRNRRAPQAADPPSGRVDDPAVPATEKEQLIPGGRA